MGRVAPSSAVWQVARHGTQETHRTGPRKQLRGGQPPPSSLQEVQERRHGMGPAERPLPPGPPTTAGFGPGRADLRANGTGRLRAPQVSDGSSSCFCLELVEKPSLGLAKSPVINGPHWVLELLSQGPLIRPSLQERGALLSPAIQAPAPAQAWASPNL